MIDNVIHALGECESTKQITNNVLKELDQESRILHDMSIEQIISSVEDSAIIMILLLIKNQLRNFRTYKNHISLQCVKNEITK